MNGWVSIATCGTLKISTQLYKHPMLSPGILNFETHSCNTTSSFLKDMKSLVWAFWESISATLVQRVLYSYDFSDDFTIRVANFGDWQEGLLTKEALPGSRMEACVVLSVTYSQPRHGLRLFTSDLVLKIIWLHRSLPVLVRASRAWWVQQTRARDSLRHYSLELEPPDVPWVPHTSRLASFLTGGMWAHRIMFEDLDLLLWKTERIILKGPWVSFQLWHLFILRKMFDFCHL